jgi:DnaJ-class molecular chaperone
MTNILCPKCKGKRIVFDPMSFGLTIYLPIALLIDAAMDASGGVTQKTCPTCKGKGYYFIPD